MKATLSFVPEHPIRRAAGASAAGTPYVPHGSAITRFIHAQARLRRGELALAALCGACAASGATLLLGLSGWFLAGAALAGSAGPMAAQAFNYLLPSAGVRGLAILRTAGRYGERLFGHRAACAALAALRPALFQGIAASPPQRALALSRGEASARLVQDVNAIESAFVRRPAPWVTAGATGAALAVLALASPWAPAVFAVGVVMQLAAGRYLARRWCDTAAGDVLHATGALKNTLGAYLPAIAELHCFGLTQRAVDTVMARDAELGAAILRHNHAQAGLSFLHAGITAVTVVAVARLAASAPLPMLALAVLASLAAMEGVAPLLRATQQDGALRAATARLDAVMETGVAAGAPQCAPAVPSSCINSGKIGPAPTLEIDGRVFPHGARVAIVGPSGCGKTALLQALLGLRPAAPGRFSVDGQALERHAIGWARSCFAYVPQEPHLLTGTVADNLRMAAPLANDRALWQALASARLDTRVRAMPRGLDTWVGDGGIALSGGECRRLALARALLRPAPWLVLDEPTEGLDNATERALIAALAESLRHTGQGLLVVSHRAAPLRLCDARITPERIVESPSLPCARPRGHAFHAPSTACRTLPKNASA